MDQITQLLNKHPWTEHVFNSVFHVAILLIVIFVCMKLIRILCKQILKSAAQHQELDTHRREREKRIITIVKLIQTTMMVVLFTMAILMGLHDFGLNIMPILTGAGVAGVAIGFGAQSLVKDWIAGFFLLVENQIRLGDFIKIGTLSGTVEKMELRITALRDDDGTLHILPNSEIKAVSNMTHNLTVAAISVVNIPLPYQIDLKAIYTILKKMIGEFELDSQWKGLLQGHVTIVGITEFTIYGLVMQLTVKTAPHARIEVAAELRRRMKLALEENKIMLSMPMILSGEERPMVS